MVAEVIDLDPPPEKKRLVSEVWVARSFAQQQGGKLAYCHGQGSWLRFDGSIWRPLEKPDVFHQIRELTAEMSAFASNADKMLRASFVAGAERFAKADPTFSRQADDWDREPLALGTPAGAVDLTTGELRPAVAADMLTKSTTVTPEELEDCERWLRFLDEVTGSDAELVHFLQRWCGYCLTGDTREQSLVFIWGDGGNGKSVFIDTLVGLLGDYAVTAPMDAFTAARHDRHPADLAMMRGARLVTATETEEGRSWAEARIKQLTGGDRISARFMGRNFFTYAPTFKITIVGNHQPVLQNVDEAARRRFCIAPFTVRPVVRDSELTRRLKDEWPGILRWMINGAVDWLAHGLPRPGVVTSATEDYFAEQDLIAQWVSSDCRSEAGNPYLMETTANLFASWAAFAKRAGEDAGSLRGFSFRLQRMGFGRKKTAGPRMMTGVELIRKQTNGGD